MRRKNKFNWLAAAGICLMFCFAYLAPEVVSSFEDSYLQSKTKNFEIEEIKFEFSNVDIGMELSIFSDLLSGEMMVHNRMAESDDTQTYKTAQKKIEEFLDILNVDNRTELEEMEIISVVLAYVDQAYPMWKCQTIDDAGLEYVFWVDEITGLVLAFEAPYMLMPFEKNDFYESVQRLSEYYSFASGEVLAYAFSDSENGTAFIRFVDKEGMEIHVPFYKMEDRVAYNMYLDLISSTYATDAMISSS